MQYRSLAKCLLSIMAGLGLCAAASALDFGGLKEKAGSVVAENGGSSLLGIGNSLYSVFKGNEIATQSAKGLMTQLKEGQYGKVFDYYDKIQGLDLSPDQLSAWNDAKGAISSYVLEEGFSFDKALEGLAAKASEALQSGDTSAATRYLGKLKSAATLTDSQSTLLSQIQAHVQPLLGGS
ncbi:hypothetical protein [Coraliomargarita parva]|uniref:hypothetical protein n=1 Tax=Coraliomargarita parva TaxID=3014050 RepID=UPI0022B55653|nr:hypothetical protein [Coraliomargarita parva]